MSNKLFVYGTLKKGFYNHVLLEKSKFLGHHITGNEFTMVDLGAYPALLEEGTTPITGEVYEITSPIAHNIDRLEGYPHFYQRKEIDTPYGKARVYYMDSAEMFEKDVDVIEEGVWRG